MNEELKMAIIRGKLETYRDSNQEELIQINQKTVYHQKNLEVYRDMCQLTGNVPTL